MIYCVLCVRLIDYFVLGCGIDYAVQVLEGQEPLDQISDKGHDTLD